MKSSLVLLAAASLASAQIMFTEYLPTCSHDCYALAVIDGTECEVVDSPCQCVPANYQQIFSFGASCMIDACTGDVVVGEVIPAARRFCAAVTGGASSSSSAPPPPPTSSPASSSPSSSAPPPTSSAQSSSAPASSSSAVGASSSHSSSAPPSSSVASPTSLPPASSATAPASSAPGRPSSHPASEPPSSSASVPSSSGVKPSSVHGVISKSKDYPEDPEDCSTSSRKPYKPTTLATTTSCDEPVEVSLSKTPPKPTKGSYTKHGYGAGSYDDDDSYDHEDGYGPHQPSVIPAPGHPPKDHVPKPVTAHTAPKPYQPKDESVKASPSPKVSAQGHEYHPVPAHSAPVQDSQPNHAAPGKGSPTTKPYAGPVSATPTKAGHIPSAFTGAASKVGAQGAAVVGAFFVLFL